MNSSSDDLRAADVHGRRQGLRREDSNTEVVVAKAKLHASAEPKRIKVENARQAPGRSCFDPSSSRRLTL